MTFHRFKRITRLGKNSYEVTGLVQGQEHTIEMTLSDTDLVEFAEMCGFEEIYGDLDVFLDGIEHWEGVILDKEVKVNH